MEVCNHGDGELIFDGETGVPGLVSVCVHRAELQEATPGFICNKTCPGDM